MDDKYYMSQGQGGRIDDVESRQRLYEQNSSTDLQDLVPQYIDEGSQWEHAHTSTTGFDYFHPMPITTNYPSMAVPATVPLIYQQSYATSDLQYNNVPPMSYQQSIYDSSAYPLSTVSTPSDYSIPPATYYSSPTLVVPGTTTTASSISSFSTPVTPLPSTSRSPSPSLSSSRSHPTSSASNIITGAATSNNDLTSYGHLNPQSGAWTCAYPHCSSKAIFVRPCDLRKHFNRHSKNFFCRHEGCPAQNSESGAAGFSSKKDRARHESKHNPGVQCEWDGCERVFSRVDNMRNHLARIHLKQKQHHP